MVIKERIKQLIPSFAVEVAKYCLSERYREIKRLESLPPRKPTRTFLLGEPLKITDAKKFLHMYEDIFRKEIYSFDPASNSPRIIDGGANIGIATLYWKKEYPNSKITAIEPDPKIFQALKYNVESRNLEDVELVQKGIWNKEKTLNFHQDEQDGGHFDHFPAESSLETRKVETIRLSSFMTTKIDMLKLDIEGAEMNVLRDIKGKLKNVENMFVEFHSYPSKKQNLDELLNILKENGFRYHLKPGVKSNKPFIKIETHNGIENTVNIFAYKK